MQGLSFSQFILKQEWDKLHEVVPGYFIYLKNERVALIFKENNIEYRVIGNRCNCPAGKYRGYCKHRDWVTKLRKKETA